MATPTPGTPQKSGLSWSEKEKTALLLSIIQSNNAKFAWKDVAIPVGRTLRSSQEMYQKLVKMGAEVELVRGEDVALATPQKRKPRLVEQGKKRGRKDDSESDETEDEDVNGGTTKHEMKFEEEVDGSIDARPKKSSKKRGKKTI